MTEPTEERAHQRLWIQIPTETADFLLHSYHDADKRQPVQLAAVRMYVSPAETFPNPKLFPYEMRVDIQPQASSALRCLDILLRLFSISAGL